MASTVTNARLRVLLVFVITIAAVSLFVWAQARRAGNENPAVMRTQDNAPAPTPASDPAPSVAPSVAPTQSPFTEQVPEGLVESDPSPGSVPLTDNYVGVLKLIIPVAGVKSGQLLDTFTDSRSEGRIHDAIDIPAPVGTPVLAATDGEVVKLFQSERGGTTIYQFSADKKLIFYYAHLQRYADGLAVGHVARQGEIIAFVGDTGNAGAGNYHLHFSIAVIADPKRYWEGKNINPYPMLRR